MISVSGVRNSWLTLAKNCGLGAVELLERLGGPPTFGFERARGPERRRDLHRPRGERSRQRPSHRAAGTGCRPATRHAPADAVDGLRRGSGNGSTHRVHRRRRPTARAGSPRRYGDARREVDPAHRRARQPRRRRQRRGSPRQQRRRRCPSRRRAAPGHGRRVRVETAEHERAGPRSSGGTRRRQRGVHVGPRTSARREAAADRSPQRRAGRRSDSTRSVSSTTTQSMPGDRRRRRRRAGCRRRCGEVSSR